MKYKTKTDCKNRVAVALLELFKNLDIKMEFFEIEVEMSANNYKVILMNDINQLNDSIHSFFGRSNFNITTSVNNTREDLFINEIEIELNFK